MTWDTVGKISIVKRSLHGRLISSMQAERVQILASVFPKVNHQVGDGYHYEFLGTVELEMVS